MVKGHMVRVHMVRGGMAVRGSMATSSREVWVQVKQVPWDWVEVSWEGLCSLMLWTVVEDMVVATMGVAEEVEGEVALLLMLAMVRIRFLESFCISGLRALWY